MQFYEYIAICVFREGLEITYHGEISECHKVLCSGDLSVDEFNDFQVQILGIGQGILTFVL
jgi:hypothetical protein